MEPNLDLHKGDALFNEDQLPYMKVNTVSGFENFSDFMVKSETFHGFHNSFMKADAWLSKNEEAVLTDWEKDKLEVYGTSFFRKAFDVDSAIDVRTNFVPTQEVELTELDGNGFESLGVSEQTKNLFLDPSSSFNIGLDCENQSRMFMSNSTGGQWHSQITEFLTDSEVIDSKLDPAVSQLSIEEPILVKGVKDNWQIDDLLIAPKDFTDDLELDSNHLDQVYSNKNLDKDFMEKLSGINVHLVNIYRGIYEPNSSKFSDYRRHVTHALRELISNTIRQLAPREQVEGWLKKSNRIHKDLLTERGPTRKARVMYVFRDRSKAVRKLVEKEISSINQLYNLFSKHAHALKSDLDRDLLDNYIEKTKNLLKSIVLLLEK